MADLGFSLYDEEDDDDIMQSDSCYLAQKIEQISSSKLVSPSVTGPGSDEIFAKPSRDTENIKELLVDENMGLLERIFAYHDSQHFSLRFYVANNLGNWLCELCKHRSESMDYSRIMIVISSLAFDEAEIISGAILCGLPDICSAFFGDSSNGLEEGFAESFLMIFTRYLSDKQTVSDSFDHLSSLLKNLEVSVSLEWIDFLLNHPKFHRPHPIYPEKDFLEMIPTHLRISRRNVSLIIVSQLLSSNISPNEMERVVSFCTRAIDNCLKNDCSESIHDHIHEIHLILYVSTKLSTVLTSSSELEFLIEIWEDLFDINSKSSATLVCCLNLLPDFLGNLDHFKNSKATDNILTKFLEKLRYIEEFSSREQVLRALYRCSMRLFMMGCAKQKSSIIQDSAIQSLALNNFKHCKLYPAQNIEVCVECLDILKYLRVERILETFSYDLLSLTSSEFDQAKIQLFSKLDTILPFEGLDIPSFAQNCIKLLDRNSQEVFCAFVASLPTLVRNSNAPEILLRWNEILSNFLKSNANTRSEKWRKREATARILVDLHSQGISNSILTDAAIVLQTDRVYAVRKAALEMSHTLHQEKIKSGTFICRQNSLDTESQEPIDELVMSMHSSKISSK